MNGFTHERDIRFPDTKANILLRGGIIDRGVLKSATNSTITMTAHFGVAKRINDVTALEVMVGSWHPVMCGDTDTLHDLYCMCDDEHCEHHEESVVVAEPEYVHEEIKQTPFNYSEPEIDETAEEVEEIVEEEETIEESVVGEEIPGQETIEEVVEEATSEEEPAVEGEEAVESEEKIIEEAAEESEDPVVIAANQDASSEVFVTGMTTSIDRPTVEVQSNTVASTTTSVNVNNQNQGNARRQVNINNNHNAKRRHR